MRDDGASLYVHLPFCVAKCRYCDFNSYAWKGQDLDRHVDAVLAEARARAAGLEPQTVFIGGGTPTLLPPALLTRFLAGLDEATGFRASAREVTMEANPESCDPERMQAAREGGVDRVSIGVQSLRSEILQVYDRVHGPDEALAAYRNAREVGFARVNLDLIYAFPGQDPADWHQDLDQVLALEPEHVSCYELAYEPGTTLTRLREAGRWREEDPETCLALFETTGARCAARGFARYEVSNFARPGEACLHNLAYWRSLEWVGIGAGAAGWRGGERRKNLERPDQYEAAIAEGRDPVGASARPEPEAVLFDHFLMGLRMPAEGVRLTRAARSSGLDPLQVWAAELDSLCAEGLLEHARDPEGEACLRTTPAGLLLLDSILERLLPDTPQ